MISVEEQINNLLYNWKDKALSIIRSISTINIITAITLLIYRYGFLLTDEETEWVFGKLDALFFAFALLFLVQLTFSSRRLEYLAKAWFETVLMFVLIVHGLANYLFGFKIILSLLDFLEFSNTVLMYQHILTVYLLLLVGLEFTKVSTKLTELELKPASTFIISFILLIAIGTGLLMLPAMTTGKSSMPFLDALFISVSASCVTGLSVVDVSTFFTLKGQIIIMLLAQVGGIGIVSFATFFASFLAKGVGIKHQSIIQDFLSSESLISATGLLRKVIIITLTIELAGAVFIFFSWDEDLIFNSLGHKVFYSVFHSVSAFCNAGFSLFSDGLNTSMLSNGSVFHTPNMDINIRGMYLLHFIIALLIILGSIGFSTVEDILTLSKHENRIFRPWREWKISTKIAVYSTGILVSIGTIGFMFLEVGQLTDRTIVEALSTSFFQSVTTRTAGFNTMDFGSLKDSTIILVIFLMFIGACPGSTGGGIKSTTFYLIALSAIGNIRGQERIEVSKRTIPSQLIHKAYSIFMFATTYNILAIFLLSISESGNENLTILQIVFEQVSAFSTVGLSMGITSDLSSFGKIIIIISMYIGRVGTLTLALALSSSVKTNSYRYPEGHVMVG